MRGVMAKTPLLTFALVFAAGFGFGFMYHHIASLAHEAIASESGDSLLPRLRSVEARLAALEGHRGEPGHTRVTRDPVRDTVTPGGAGTGGNGTRYSYEYQVGRLRQPVTGGTGTVYSTGTVPVQTHGGMYRYCTVTGTIDCTGYQWLVSYSFVRTLLA